MKRIIEDPAFLVGPTATYETGAMGGQTWDSPTAFEAIQQYVPELPHLIPVLVAFFKGAVETWKRFTSEFAPGGLIDEAKSSMDFIQIKRVSTSKFVRIPKYSNTILLLLFYFLRPG